MCALPRRLGLHLPLCLLLHGTILPPPSSSAQLILPSTCRTVAVDSFGVRLDLRYFYLIEYDDLGDDDMALTHLDLSRFDQAIATAIVDELSNCGSDGRPQYGVLLSKHEPSNKGDGSCDPMSDKSACQVIRGTTSVLINGNDVSVAQNASLTVIERVLSDSHFLVDYTGFPLLRSEFVRFVGDTVVVLESGGGADTSGGSGGGGGSNEPNQDGQFKLKVYVGATCAALIIVLIAIAALYRNHRVAVKRRRFFQLEDQDSRWMTVDGTLVDSLDHDYEAGARNCGGGDGDGDDDGGARGGNGSDGGDHSPRHRTAWSVSDLTSDSQSIRSSLPMDRIAEEEASSHHTEDDGNEGQGNSGEEPKRHFNFIAHWKDPVGSEDLTDDDEEATPVRRNQVGLASATGLGGDATTEAGFCNVEPGRTDEKQGSRQCQSPGQAPKLQPFMIQTSPSSATASSDGDNDNEGKKRLLKTPNSDAGEWKGVRLTTPRVISVASMEVKRSLFRGDPLWRSKVFRPRQPGPDSTGSSSHPRIPGPLPSPAARLKEREPGAKENREPPSTTCDASAAASPLRYNTPLVASSSESSSTLGENVEVALDEAGKILKSWASSTMQSLSVSRHQKRLASP